MITLPWLIVAVSGLTGAAMCLTVMEARFLAAAGRARRDTPTAHPVWQHVEAVEPLNGGGDGSATLLAVGHVGRDGERLTSCRGGFADDFVEGGGGAGGHDDAGA